jgi:Carboxypeptidase regulatory-like domain
MGLSEKKWAPSIVLVCLSFLGPGRMCAQDLATISGTVADASGAGVPGATITLSNPDRGVTRVLVTDSAGEYVAVRIPTGAYQITAEKDGFEKQIQTGIVVGVGQTLRVDIQMKVGSNTEKITIEANIPRVETETGTLSDTITSSQVTQLNLNNRNFVTLATLVPGAATLGNGVDPTQISPLASVAIAFNGLPGQFNNWEVDGVNNVDQGDGSNSLMLFPNLDSLQEFRISTSIYSAEFGKSAAANVQVATKSGTRDFHGDAFEFLRNDVLDANDWFLNRAGQPREPLKRNNYGFTFGGPFFIPHHYNSNRNKTFFFVAEEWRSNRQGTVINSQVPTARMRTGDFSECDPVSPNYIKQFGTACVLPTNPTTGLPYPNDTIPVDPTAQTLLNGLIPLPNNNQFFYTAAPSLATDFREDMFRVDHNFSDKTRLFVRYTQEAYTQQFLPTLWSPSNFATVKTIWRSPVKQGVVHLTQSFRTDLLNEIILGYSNDVNEVRNSLGFDSVAGSIDKPAGFAAKTIFPGNQAQPFLPSFTVSGGLPFSFGESTGFQFFFYDPQIEVKDNLFWTKGKHTLKFGVFYQNNAINTTTNIGLPSQGQLGFSNSSTVTTGNALADFYLGRIATYEEYGRVTNGNLVGGVVNGHWRQRDFEPYVQDDWRVSQHLTLNLGVRYFWLTPFTDITNPTNDSVFVPAFYDPSKQAQLDANGNLIPGTGANYLNYGNGLLECGKPPLHSGCFPPYRGTVSPRFGFSWDPTGSGKLAVRGGYALTWDSSNPLTAGAGFNGNPPTATTLNVFNVVGYGNIGPGPLGPASFSNIPTDQKWPQVQNFSLGIQKELWAKTLLTVNYVGTLAHHLHQSLNQNQVLVGSTTRNVPALANTPGCDAQGNCDVQQILMNNLEPNIFFVPYRGYTTITNREEGGSSNYNALQVTFRGTIARSLNIQAAYTWSHTLDDILNPSTSSVDSSNVRRWYGNSYLNQAQMLVLNYIYDIPFFERSNSTLARALLNGWQISGITSFLTGPPLDFTCGINGLSSGIGGSVKCNPVGDFKVKKGVVDDPTFGPTPTWFDPSTIAQVNLSQLAANNQPGMFGTLGKNVLTGPGRNNWDLGIMRSFRIPKLANERTSVQFRFETFNTFNHPQWSGINLSCSGATAPGAPCNGPNNVGNGEVSSAYPARIVQIGLKFLF